MRGNTSSRREGMPTQKTQREERERPPALWLLFSCLSPPLGLPYVNWASQECCLSHPRSSLRSSDLPLFCFPRLFLSLSFSRHHSGLLFPILPNKTIKHVKVECIYSDLFFLIVFNQCKDPNVKTKIDWFTLWICLCMSMYIWRPHRGCTNARLRENISYNKRFVFLNRVSTNL